MIFYSSLATTASALLLDKGQLVTFSRQTGGTFDPVPGSESGASTTTFTGYAAALSYNRMEMDNVLVMKGDVKLILESTTTVPLVDDKCTVDSVDYRVMSVEKVSPGGTTVIYKVQLRV